MFNLELLKNLFKKPVTVKYPKGELKSSELVRQRLTYNYDKCVGSFECAKVCPVTAIRAHPAAKKISIDLGICIGCGRCVYVCPVIALSFEPKFNNAVYDRKDLIIGYLSRHKEEMEKEKK